MLTETVAYIFKHRVTQKLSQFFVAPALTFLNLVALMRFGISIYFLKAITLMR